MDILQRILTLIDRTVIRSRHKSPDHWEKVKAEGKNIHEEITKESNKQPESSK
jgi:hypothetical protein